MTTDVWYGRVLPHAATGYERGFIDCYQEAFAGEPYFEHYSYEEVHEEVWVPHLKDGVIIIAQEQGIVGFGCALPLDKSPADVQEFLSRRAAEGELPADFNHRGSWYMSELGVRDDTRLRRRGLGYELVRHRMISLVHSGADQYFMRTDATSSNSIHLYERIGAKRLSETQDMSSSSQVKDNGSKSESRVYLWGNCDEALSAIGKIQSEHGYIPYGPQDLEDLGED